jgi:hypothetical protein
LYFSSVILLLFVFPIVSVAINAHLHPNTEILVLIGRWFTFWAVGVRLFIAGIRQVVQPEFTAHEIFQIPGKVAIPIVREVGFANLSMGLLGLTVFIRPEWTIPAALVGGLYYGLAGAGHVGQRDKNAKEQTALLSDLFVFLVLATFVIKSLYSPG